MPEKLSASVNTIPHDELAPLVAKSAALPVYDADGNKLDFGSLFRDQKTIVVFIRHFFCGSCQQYVMQLASVRSDALQNANTRLVVIGCGDWKLIKNYCELTDFKGAMYADPSRALYDHFGFLDNLDRTPADQEKRSYLQGKSFLGNVARSIWEGPLKNPLFIGKQGKISQNGGELILGPGESASFGVRMNHTEDHVDVEDLMKEAGVEYP